VSDATHDVAHSPLGQERVRSRGAHVTAIVVNYESGDDLALCLDSLSGQQGLVETIVVDNGSADDSAAVAENRPATVLVTPDHNRGFAGGANDGARHALGEYLLFLNPDVRLAPGAVVRLVEAMSARPETAVVGPRIDLERSRHAELGSRIDPLGSPIGSTASAKPFFVPGCVLMTRADVFHALGGFDDRFFMFVEDADYCWRALLAGHDVSVVPQAVAWHAGGGSAPGGYVTQDGLATTRFRMRLRERNTLAMLVKCYGGGPLAAIVPLYLLQTLLTALVLVALRRPRTALDVLAGLWWNAQQLRRTLELRAAAQAVRRRPDREIVGRMHRGWCKASAVLRSGLPAVDEQPVPRGGNPTPTPTE
jgi:GT2 family glycosyltransferase